MTRSLGTHEVLNSLQPIFKLPFELLTRIVYEVLPSPLDQHSDSTKRPVWRSAACDARALLPVSQTCRRLREVILADVMLWRHMATGDRHFNQLLLSRSGPTSPLTVVGRLGQGTPLQVPLTPFHRQLVPRLQELHFLGYVDESVAASTLMRFLELPFPHLESFSLTGSDSTMSRQTTQNLTYLPLSGTNAPRLRYLSLGLTTFLPSESGFPRLTHLSLSFITAPNLHSRVTNLLRNCPQLTSLVLRRLQCSTRIATLDFWRPMARPDPLQVPLHTDSSTLSRVILADMDPNLVEYYAALFSRVRPCIQVPIAERDPFASREREVFGALYRQYACVHEAGPEDTYMNVPRLCLATHAVDHASRSFADGTMAAFSVTLANSTDLLRVIVSWPKLLERDPYGRRNWQTDVLAPLSSLAGVREVWLADVDVITDQWCDMPIWNFADPVDLAPVADESSKQVIALPLPALASVGIVHNCSSRLRLPGPIQPSIGVLPKAQRCGAGAAGRPPLEHLRLAIGYDSDDLPRLRGVWDSSIQDVAAANSESSEPHRDGNFNLNRDSNSNLKVDLSTHLLRLLTSNRDDYAYVMHARLVVQLMPGLVLDADELAPLRGLFAAVEVEAIDRLPTVPVPERVMDEVLDPGHWGFIPWSVLC